MTGAAAAFARLYEVLEKIEPEYIGLSPANRRKVLLAVSAVLGADNEPDEAAFLRLARVSQRRDSVDIAHCNEAAQNEVRDARTAQPHVKEVQGSRGRALSSPDYVAAGPRFSLSASCRSTSSS